MLPVFPVLPWIHKKYVYGTTAAQGGKNFVTVLEAVCHVFGEAEEKVFDSICYEIGEKI